MKYGYLEIKDKDSIGSLSKIIKGMVSKWGVTKLDVNVFPGNSYKLTQCLDTLLEVPFSVSMTNLTTEEYQDVVHAHPGRFNDGIY